MRAVRLTLAYVTADPDGVSLLAALAGDTLAINGALASGGSVTLPGATQVTITSTDDLSEFTFTVVGTSATGAPLSEDIAGPNNGTVTTVASFLTITAIDYDGTPVAEQASAGVAVSSTNVTAPIPMDQYLTPFNVGMGVDITTTGINVTVQHTFDNVFATGYDPSAGTWFAHPTLASLTADADGNYAFPVSAIRLKANSGTGAATFNVLQAGVFG